MRRSVSMSKEDSFESNHSWTCVDVNSVRPTDRGETWYKLHTQFLGFVRNETKGVVPGKHSMIYTICYDVVILKGSF